MNFESINYLAVFVAAVSSFIVGGVWYSKKVLGAAWMAENGFTDDDIEKGSMLSIFGGTLFFAFVKALFLAAFIMGQEADIMASIGIATIISLAWGSTFYGTHYLFERKSFRLFAIHAGHDLLGMILMAVILTLWQ